MVNSKQTLLDIAMEIATQSGEKRRHGAALMINGRIVTGYNEMYCLLQACDT